MKGCFNLEVGPYWMKCPEVTLDVLEQAKSFINLCIAELESEKSVVPEQTEKGEGKT